MTNLWLIYFACVFSGFAALEGYAIATGQMTLTRYVRDFTAVWPVLPIVVSVVICIVAIHLWWTGK